MGRGMRSRTDGTGRVRLHSVDFRDECKRCNEGCVSEDRCDGQTAKTRQEKVAKARHHNGVQNHGHDEGMSKVQKSWPRKGP